MPDDQLDPNVDIVIDCDDPGFVPMADPEGNEFCVCPGAPLDL